MKILVTGATGFIGNYVVSRLLQMNVEVIATSSHSHRARKEEWFKNVQFIEHDIHQAPSENLLKKFNYPDKVIHLAWAALNDFKSQRHVDEILPAHYTFLTNLIENGLKDLTVVGTCLEYGMQEGQLREDMESKPTIAYPIAKSKLYTQLIKLQAQVDFSFKWVRLFYMYGKGQSAKSILPLLQKALDEHAPVFNMSLGEQVRDYLPVDEVAENIIKLALQREVVGIVNCSSNHPISIKQLVSDYLKSKNKSIDINYGYYPYTDYEPFQFWGDNAKLLKIKK